MDATGRIDTHQHIAPPDYHEWLDSRGITAGGMPAPDWSPSAAISFMDGMRIQTGIASISSPGTHLGDDAEARTWARRVNEFAAELVKDRPDRFGFFAILPLPDIDGALAELAYSLDDLQADGVVLLSNHRGTYLGDPAFEPVMAELDRRRAPAFVHPADLPAAQLPGVPAFVADFLLDTVRAATRLIASRTTTRHPRIKFILSHAGGFLPYAAHHVAETLVLKARLSGDATGPDRDTILAEMRDFYYDTALSASPASLTALIAFADPARISFGSDWPYAPADVASYFTQQLDTYPLDPQQRRAINRANVEELFPRLAM
ncbi:putative TIM-barrel fold metal-dependent hydrolase [Nocardiopsis mwathae]|uniref:Putative TIM-barrel fold metal-dependent hydrolase n=1 Tax=Nocardiopsis mwathae TaxID=1472723 RepID=A0A7X0D4T4_9ACTN|nr:amidohydrolase family protein [Nocardiopsis mwathae]MBB6171647.1 putative TIM-barrel fold metal-dependent hydrolase [Nocardiopsis mwathae]